MPLSDEDLSNMCGCGVPLALGVVHREGRPCYLGEETVKAQRDRTLEALALEFESSAHGAETNGHHAEAALLKNCAVRTRSWMDRDLEDMG